MTNRVRSVSPYTYCTICAVRQSIVRLKCEFCNKKLRYPQSRRRSKFHSVAKDARGS